MNDPEQHGYYYVNPPTDAAALAEHNTLGLMHTCVHEAWPGHHLQFVTANLNPQARSLPRLVNSSATPYEAWALYCEQLMHEQGLLGAPSSVSFCCVIAYGVLRVQLDVELQTRLSIAAVADRMQSTLGFPRAQVLAVWRGIPAHLLCRWVTPRAGHYSPRRGPGWFLNRCLLKTSMIGCWQSGRWVCPGAGAGIRQGTLSSGRICRLCHS